jgi:3-deoxy-D-arabino-heptulosonate 7-phosphate (DAHP) synthase class II
MMEQVIGRRTRCIDGEFGHLDSYIVEVLGVIKAGKEIKSDVELESMGGLNPNDIVIIAPIIRGHPSKVHSRPIANDLECFQADDAILLGC